jgi:ActR/RegA family two-component response regulator
MPRWTWAELERRYIARVVRRASSLSEAARQLGLHRRTLQRKLDNLRIERDGCLR